MFFFSYMIELLSIFFLTAQEISTSTLGLSKERGASSKSVHYIEIFSPPSLTTKSHLLQNNICLKYSNCILLPHSCPNDYLIHQPSQSTIHPPTMEEIEFNAYQNTKGLQWVSLKIILNFKKIKSSVRCLKFLIFRTFVLSVSCPK